jgi:hypothetical protein
MHKSKLKRAVFRNVEHLLRMEYYVAWVDELDIEAKLLRQLENKKMDTSEDPIEIAMREALGEIDKLKIEGRLEAERSRLQQLPDIEDLSKTLDRTITRVQRDYADFFEYWDNLREGMESPDPDQRERFNRFYEAAGLGPKKPWEIIDLIAVLEPAKKKKKSGRKPIPNPKWRNDVDELNEMLTLVASGLSAKAASEKVIEAKAEGWEESRAKRLANFYRERQKLR